MFSFLFLIPSVLSLGEPPTFPPNSASSTVTTSITTVTMSITTVTINGHTAQPVSPIGTDLNCTFLNPQRINVYSERATGCFNVYNDLDCQSKFGNISGVLAGTNLPRPPLCSQNQGSAVSNCARFCGYCCLTDAFNCINNPNSTINCSALEKQRCLDPILKPLIVENCPNVCGFCNENGCVDKDDICRQQTSICQTNPSFSAQNCRRTCGLCKPYGTLMPGACTDRYSSCPTWKLNGYCESRDYTSDDKRRDCAFSCGLC